MHVKLRMNLRRQRRKPKYSLATDSEPVPRGKGEKNRCERSEIVPEMMCLQGVEAGSILRIAERPALSVNCYQLMGREATRSTSALLTNSRQPITAGLQSRPG